MNPIELAQQKVHEEITGECWHKWSEIQKAEVAWEIVCTKCKKVIGLHAPLHGCFDNPPPNPPFATSLDAWAEHIWPYIWNPNGIPIDKQVVSIGDYAYWVAKCCGAVVNRIPEGELEGLLHIDITSAYFVATATPLHHLEAALRSLSLWDDDTYKEAFYG